MKRTAVAAGLAIALALPAVSGAEGFAPAKGEDALRYRQSALFMMGQNFGALVAMAKGDRPWDAALVAGNTERVQFLSTLPWDSFWVTGADQGKHRMKPEIFTEKDKFLEKANALQEQAQKLAAVAKTSDQAAIKAQIVATGKACGACHDAYRVK
jgi:cytochrome c556